MSSARRPQCLAHTVDEAASNSNCNLKKGGPAMVFEGMGSCAWGAETSEIAPRASSPGQVGSARSASA
eukprot:588923-Amphidinium_carterae.1